MKYESLYSLYYKDSQIWEKVYQERFHSPFSRHLPLAIKQYHRRQSHPAFFCYTEEIALSLEKIASEVMDCLDIIHQVPPAAISQFCIRPWLMKSNRPMTLKASAVRGKKS